MSSVLVLDGSATLRHVLGKMLSAAGHKVRSTSDFLEGLDFLRSYESGSPKHQFDALILGWPTHPSAIVGDVIQTLASGKLRNLPTLVLTLEKGKDITRWCNSRPRTIVLKLDDYTQLIENLTPLLEKQQPRLEAVPTPAPANNAIRILFVDDSRTVRAMLKRLLTKQGYLVDVAPSGREALTMARRRIYDIGIIDFFMPDANGDEICRKLKSDSRTSHMMTAIFTATYLDKVIQDSLEAGASDCMFKTEADELFLARVAAMSRTIRTRRAVEKESKRLDGILSSVGEGVYGVESSGALTFLNPAAKTILGYGTKDDLSGQSAQALFHYAHKDGSVNNPETCFLQQAYELGDELHDWETTFWTKNNQPLSVLCTVYPLRIEGRLQGSVVAFRDISSQKNMEEELKWQVDHDHLTKLRSRQYFDEELRREVGRMRHNRREHSALLYIDLDRFKYINDTAGHKAGDELLITVGKQLTSRLRKDDMLARLGGDEFAIIIRNIRPYDLDDIADKFVKLLQESRFSYVGTTYKINGSIGATLINWESTSPDDILAHADIACHIAKQKGRNRYHIYDFKNDEKLAMDVELGWSTRLHEALEQNSFVLNFQPIARVGDIDFLNPNADICEMTENTRISEYEVLIRLPGRSPGKQILPNAFIPTAERFNLMHRIDRWVIEHALSKLQEQDTNGSRISLAINLSGYSLGNKDLREEIPGLLQCYNIDPTRINFEITETSAIENIETAQRFIADLTRIGCKFSLDDFGCGFSSFSHLKHLDVSHVKIDGMFVQEMVHSTVDQAMVRSIIDIAHALGKKTVAEFVENSDQLRMLHALRVDYVQGFGIGRPQPGFGEDRSGTDTSALNTTRLQLIKNTDPHP